MVISNADQSNYARKFVTNSTQIASDKQTNKHAHTHTHKYARTLFDLRSFVVRNFKKAKK